jgi:LuxR family maltose regulon positive regulatory protein
MARPDSLRYNAHMSTQRRSSEVSTVPATLLSTKLYGPRVRPELVSRPRLIERLNQGLHRQLTLVSAPAGFGKTTLIAEWLAGSQRAFTWLSVDETDNDPVRFLDYLVAALQEITGEIGWTVRGSLGSPRLPPAESLITSLINDIAGVPEPFTLVLDDYHLIHSEWIHQALEFLISHQPPQMHLVILTRRDPPLRLPRLRVRDQVTEIRVDDLRFTPEEAAAFLTRVLGLVLGADVVASLESRTEGWIAGLQLATLSLQGKSSEQAARFVQAFSGSHHHVIDYLADEVLARQPAEIRDFLRQTAILDRLTAPLCDALTGRPNSEQLLRQLEDANLFLIPLDDQREWYRYHQLFADFLRTDLDEGTRAALHLKAMHWLEAHHLRPEAVKHALASGDMVQAAQMIARAAGDAFRRASWTTLLGWLEALPDELVRADGELATYRGFLLFLTEFHAEAAAYAEAAERSLSPDEPVKRGRLLSLKAHLALRYDDFDIVVQLCREALAYLGEEDPLFRSLTLNVLGQIMERREDLAAAADAYREAALSGRQAGDQLGAVVALTNLVLALNELGRRREALALCQEVAEAAAAQPGRELPVAEGIDLAWGWLSYEANELDRARKQSLRALHLCEQLNIADGIFIAQFTLARAHLACGEPERTLEICRQARERAARIKPGAPQAGWFAALEAQVWLQQGDLAAAASWAERAALAPTDTPHFWYEPVYFTYIRLLLSQRRLEEADAILTTLERSARQGGRRRKLITLGLQRALFHQAQSREGQAQASIREALLMAAPEGYRRAFLDEGRPIMGSLPALRHVTPAFVDGLLEAFRNETLSPAEGRPSPAWTSSISQGELTDPLSERELEILRLVAAGRSNPEIADLLYLSLNTVKWHVKNLYGKLNVHSRVEAAARAQELGLL